MDIRYVAGLFDGEGTVRIARWKKPGSTHIRYSVYVGLGMTHRPVIEALQQQFGGSVHENRHDLRNSKHRIQFLWVAASRIGSDFLRRVLPHLIVKKDEAELAIALQDHIDKTPYVPTGRPKLNGGIKRPRDNSEEILTYREDLFRRITTLKKRTYPSLTA